MPIAEYLARSFRGSDPANRGPIMDAVIAAGFSIENIQEDFDTPQKWGLILKPNRALAEMFRLDREVLLWCSTYPRFQARDIDDMSRVMANTGVRLTRTFAILVTSYRPESRNATEAEAALDTTVVHCSLAELRAGDASATPALTSILLRRLYTRDPYDLPTATTRAADFFGRRKLVDDLADEVTAGSAQLGVFGLRKIGKTSLLNRVCDLVQQSGKCIVAKLDLQWTTSIDPSAEYTLWTIGEAIYSSGRPARAAKDFQLFGQFRSLRDARAQLDIWEGFASDIQSILRTTNRRILLAIDEIERIYEISASSEFVRLWRLMRGLDQQFPGRLRYVISGTSPECAETSTIDGEDNPLYQYLSVRYLGPLSPSDTGAMLQSLGGGVGLQWGRDSLELVSAQTGGHPALVRTVGSIVHRSTLPRLEPKAVTRSHATLAANQLLDTASPVLAQITASLRDRYEDEFVLLRMLASGEIFDFRELAQAYPDALSHLIGYGLLPDGAASIELKVRLLQTYLQRLTSGTPAVVGERRPGLQAGEKVDRWTVTARISRGGFADVFSGEDRSSGEKIAIKVFHAAKLSDLEREVEYLRSLSHPNIVRFEDATESSTGLPCILMEMLDGKPLGRYCDSTNALPTDAVVRVADELLDALQYMHPKVQSGVGALGHDLTSQEFEQWKQDRLGVIHRDIKPENVILTRRGAVLVDFNIAVRAADPVVTTTATPGYLPPGLTGLYWTPQVDLYQLGVTLAQIAGGFEFNQRNLEDLLESASARHPPPLARWIRTLLTADPGTAADARRALRRLGFGSAAAPVND